MTSMQDSKDALRREVLSRRDALTEANRIEMSLEAEIIGLGCPALAADSLPGRVIAGFLPIRSEIDPRTLMFSLASQKARLCLPVVVDRETIEFRELVRGAPLTDSGFGTVGPDASANVLDPDILLMPLSAYDRKGGRMGYGAGFYDRAIARLINKGLDPVLLGIAFSIQEAKTVPMEPHDRYLNGVITEKEFISVSI